MNESEPKSELNEFPNLKNILGEQTLNNLLEVVIDKELLLRWDKAQGEADEYKRRDLRRQTHKSVFGELDEGKDSPT